MCGVPNGRPLMEACFLFFFPSKIRFSVQKGIHSFLPLRRAGRVMHLSIPSSDEKIIDFQMVEKSVSFVYQLLSLNFEKRRLFMEYIVICFF
jgi:hypothetical protein